MPREAKHPKTPDARAAEARQLTDQLQGVGLPEEVTRPVVRDLEAFAATGQGVTRTVRVPGTPIDVHVLLSNQAHVASHIRIARRR